MEIKVEKLSKLVKKADEIFLTAEGEEVLVQLLEIRDQVEKAIDEAETKLEATALKLNPNFKSIQSDRVKVYYRAYGSRYYVDESRLTELDPELYKVVKRYSVETKAVDKWVKEHKGMPVGIVEVDRKKSLKFGLKKGAK